MFKKSIATNKAMTIVTNRRYMLFDAKVGFFEKWSRKGLQMDFWGERLYPTPPCGFDILKSIKYETKK